MTLEELRETLQHCGLHMSLAQLDVWSERMYKAMIPFLYRDAKNPIQIHILDIRPVKDMSPAEFELYYYSVSEITQRMPAVTANNWLHNIYMKSHCLKIKKGDKK
jgi:hypothetical protein